MTTDPAEEQTKKELYSKSNHQLVDLILNMKKEIEIRDKEVRTLYIKLYLSLMAGAGMGLILIFQNKPI